MNHFFSGWTQAPTGAKSASAPKAERDTLGVICPSHMLFQNLRLADALVLTCPFAGTTWHGRWPRMASMEARQGLAVLETRD
jgi:hypothetical protein